MIGKSLLRLSTQSWNLEVLDSGRCAQHIWAVWKGWSVGRCEIKCEIKQVAALRLVGVCYSGIPRCSFYGPMSSENILTDPCWCHINASCILAQLIRWCRRLHSPGRQTWVYFVPPLFFPPSSLKTMLFLTLLSLYRFYRLQEMWQTHPLHFSFHDVLCIMLFKVRNHEDKQLMLAFIFMNSKTFLSSSIPLDCTGEILYLWFISFFPCHSSSLYFCPR